VPVDTPGVTIRGLAGVRPAGADHRYRARSHLHARTQVPLGAEVI
jgi:hypothetical protein